MTDAEDRLLHEAQMVAQERECRPPNQSVEEFLKEEPLPIILIGDRRLYWDVHGWMVIRMPFPQLPQHPNSLLVLYEGPLLSEALNCLRTGAPYWRKEEK